MTCEKRLTEPQLLFSNAGDEIGAVLKSALRDEADCGP